MKPYKPILLPFDHLPTTGLPVNELFYSVQGEGRWLGTPALFLRLHYCNVGCTWCDTKYTWSPEHATAVEWLSNPKIIERAQQLIPDKVKENGTLHFVLTGGESLLFQDRFPELRTGLSELGVTMVEVETSGTIVPTPKMISAVDWWNCSPKLSNSGIPAEVRINRAALKTIAGSGHADYKFVVRNEEDVKEILHEFSGIIPHNHITLMPEGQSRAAQLKRLPEIIQLALTYGLRCTPRLHTLVWNSERGR